MASKNTLQNKRLRREKRAACRGAEPTHKEVFKWEAKKGAFQVVGLTMAAKGHLTAGPYRITCKAPAQVAYPPPKWAIIQALRAKKAVKKAAEKESED